MKSHLDLLQGLKGRKIIKQSITRKAEKLSFVLMLLDDNSSVIMMYHTKQTVVKSLLKISFSELENTLISKKIDSLSGKELFNLLIND